MNKSEIEFANEQINRMSDLISSCKHGIGEIYLNPIGERCLFCEIWDEQRNIDLGDCLGNCESEELKWRGVQNE